MKVGIFADGIWGFNIVKILFFDKSFNIDFVVLRKKKDLKLTDIQSQEKIFLKELKSQSKTKPLKDH